MLLSFVLCVVLIGADQLIKYLVSSSLAPNGAATLIPGVVELRYYENNGAAFSIMQGKQGFLIAVTGLALLGAVIYVLRFHKLKGFWEHAAFILVFSGGVGNLIDRVSNGYVVDYVNLIFMRFAVFNLADIMVCVGFAFLVVAVFRYELMVRKQEKPDEAEAAVDGPDSHGND